MFNLFEVVPMNQPKKREGPFVIAKLKKRIIYSLM